MPEQQSLHVLTFVARVGDDVGAHGCAQQLLRRVTRQEGNPVDGRVVDLPVDIGQLSPDGIKRKTLWGRPDPACDPPQPAGEQLVGPDSRPEWPQGRAMMIGQGVKAKLAGTTKVGRRVMPACIVRPWEDRADARTTEDRLYKTDHVQPLGCPGRQHTNHVRQQMRIARWQRRLKILAQPGDARCAQIEFGQATAARMRQGLRSPPASSSAPGRASRGRSARARTGLPAPQPAARAG